MQELLESKIARLKTALFDGGLKDIEDFAGTDKVYDWDKDTIDNLLDEVLDQMPLEELQTYFEKYHIE